MRRILSALPLAGLMLVNSAYAATVITTFPASGLNWAPEFGNAGTATPIYGQTFVVPTTDTYLTSYTSAFAFQSLNEFKFRLYVAPWDDTSENITSAPVFASSDLTSADAASGFKTYTVSMNLKLNGGGKYMAFYSVVDLVQPSAGTMVMELADSNAYADGGFAYNSALHLNDIGSTVWTTDYTDLDTAFTANFASAPLNPVPEPASVAALGVGALALVRRRRVR